MKSDKITLNIRVPPGRATSSMPANGSASLPPGLGPPGLGEKGGVNRENGKKGDQHVRTSGSSLGCVLLYPSYCNRGAIILPRCSGAYPCELSYYSTRANGLPHIGETGNVRNQNENGMIQISRFSANMLQTKELHCNPKWPLCNWLFTYQCSLTA